MLAYPVQCEKLKIFHGNNIAAITIVLRFYSRSYAEDVTSVTSGASQGPHNFNLVFVCVFVCLFVCVTPGAIRI